jgi:hypothetical protein
MKRRPANHEIEPTRTPCAQQSQAKAISFPAPAADGFATVNGNTVALERIIRTQTSNSTGRNQEDPGP